MKKPNLGMLFVLSAAVCVYAQAPILTVNAFFKTVSETYASIRDYEADMTVTVNKRVMRSRVSFKRPNLLRVDFSNPETQVIVFNGEQLTVYLPGPRAILSQSLQRNSRANGASIATPQGLALMNRYYSIVYETGQEPVPLDEGSDEQVIKLILSRKNTAEGFRTVKLSVNPSTLLIRRVEAVSALSGDVFKFDFTNYALNQNIPDTRFLYDAPSSANTYNNFLFTE